jgi:hypothetical protein
LIPDESSNTTSVFVDFSNSIDGATTWFHGARGFQYFVAPTSVYPTHIIERQSVALTFIGANVGSLVNLYGVESTCRVGSSVFPISAFSANRTQCVVYGLDSGHYRVGLSLNGQEYMFYNDSLIVLAPLQVLSVFPDSLFLLTQFQNITIISVEQLDRRSVALKDMRLVDKSDTR